MRNSISPNSYLNQNKTMSENTSVCNLKNIMFIRFVLGFRQNYTKSRTLRLISKLYPICLTGVIFYIMSTKVKLLPIYMKCSYCSEYLFYVIVSYITEDKYISNYFKNILGIDNMPGAKQLYKQLDNFLKFSVTLIFVIKIYLAAFFCYLNPAICFDLEVFGFFTTQFVTLACYIGRFTTVLIFGLLYFRTKVVKMTLKADFYNTLQRFSIHKYVQMYDTLVDTPNIVDHPLKLMVRVHCFIFFNKS